MSDSVTFESSVRGYHYYQDNWDPVIGEQLECTQESEKLHKRYAVAIRKERVIVGRILRKISTLCYLCLRKGRSIISTITGNRSYSRDLAQGGMELPCTLRFSCKNNRR